MGSPPRPARQWNGLLLSLCQVESLDSLESRKARLDYQRVCAQTMAIYSPTLFNLLMLVISFSAVSSALIRLRRHEPSGITQLGLIARQGSEDKNGGDGRESLYWDGDVRNYYPAEPKSQGTPDLELQTDIVPKPQRNQGPGPLSDPKPIAQGSPNLGLQSNTAPVPQSSQGKDDIVRRQSGPPVEDGPDKGGPMKTKENLDEGIFEKSTPQQDYDDSSYVDVDHQRKVENGNEGLEYKTKNVSEDGVNDIGEKGPAVGGEGSQVNTADKQTKNEMEKQEDRGTLINDVKGSWASQVNTNELP